MPTETFKRKRNEKIVDIYLKELEDDLKQLKKEDPASFGSSVNYENAINRTKLAIRKRNAKLIEETYDRKINQATTKTELKRLRTKLNKDKEVDKYDSQTTLLKFNIGDKIRKKSRITKK